MATEQPHGQAAQPYGEIYDLGYQHYTGSRQGRPRAVQALVLYSVKRGLGIKKKWTSKIIPSVLYMAAFIPAFIIAGLIAFLGSEEVEFGYSGLYDYIQFVLLIFAAALAPEMLCDDRRENVLSLYFSRALTRFDYLLGKVGGMAILMLSIALGPTILLFFAQVLLADSPLSYFGDHVGDLGRIAASGLLIAIYYAAIGLGVAAFTDRKGVASAIIIGLVIFLFAISNALFESLDGGMRRFAILFSPLDVIHATNVWLFDATRDQMIRESDLPNVVYPAAVLIVAAASAVIMYRRYLAED